MLASIKGYYNGKQIVMAEDINMTVGQEVIITILDMPQPEPKKIELKNYMGRGKKMFDTDAQEHIKELRNHDRL